MDKDKETIQGIEDEAPLQEPKTRKSIGRRIWIWFRRGVLTLFILIVSLMVALQIPAVQTWLAHRLSDYLLKEYNVDVHIHRVNINLFRKTVMLEEIMIRDHHQDTMIHAGIIRVDVGNIYTKKAYLDVSRVVLQNAYFNLHTYKGEQTPNLTQLINKFKGEPKKKKEKKKGKQWTINFDALIFDECKLRIRNENQPVMNADFLPSDIRVNGIAGRVDNFQIRGDTLEMDVENLQAFEGSGLGMKKLSSHVIISSKELTFKGFKLNTYKSSIGGYFSMRYRNWQSFSHFNDSIYMIADLDLSDINAGDLSYFTNGLKGIDFNFRFRGGVSGTLSHLTGTAFSLYFGSITQMVGDISLDGLPNIDSTYIKFKVKKLTTDALDLGKIPIPPFYKQVYLSMPAEIQRLGVVKYKGNIEGYLSDLAIDGEAQTQIGRGKVNVRLYKPTPKSEYSYKGFMDISLFNLGKLTAMPDQLGTITFTANISGKGFNPQKGGNANFDGKIKQFELRGYNYKNITVDAMYAKNVFTGKVQIDDPNAQLIFDGIINLNDKNQPEFDFRSEVKKLDLAALKLIKLDSSTIVGTTMVVQMKGKNIDEMQGHIEFINTTLQKANRMYEMDTFMVDAIQVDSIKTIDLHSDFVDARFKGQFKFIPMWNEIEKQVKAVAPSLGIFPDDKITYAPQDFYFYIDMKSPSTLTEVFMPDLKIANGTTVEGKLQNRTNNIYVEVNSRHVQYKKFAVNDWYFVAKSKGDQVKIQSEADQLFISDSTRFDNFNMAATAHDDSVDLWVGFQNEVLGLNGGSINLHTYFGKAPEYTFNFHDSYFYFNDSLWVVNDDNRIVINKTDILIENLSLRPSGTKDPILNIHGKSSDSDTNKITASLQHFPLKVLNALMPDKLRLQGDISGDVDVYRILQKPYLTSDLEIKTLTLNNILLGDLEVRSNFDTRKDVLTIFTNLNNNGQPILTIKDGKYYPNAKDSMFNIYATINGLNLSAVEQMAAPVFSQLKGMAYGDFSLKGNAKEPKIKCNLNLKNAGLRLDYLNAFFNFDMGDKKIEITDQIIKIPQLELTDRFGNGGSAKGKITHDLFKKMFLDIKLETRNMCVMETTEKNNEQFYGSAFTTGKATIIGPMDDIVVAANMTTNAGTVLNIPINSSKSVKQNTFVDFINPNDTLTKADSIKVKQGNFTIDLNITATPAATVRIIFDETVGDVITAQGNSDRINLTLDTKGHFSMSGSYEITKGSYLFTLQNIISKQFSIKPGSTITFNGDPYYAQVNATAVYRANASVYPIIASFMDPTTAENYRRATKVDCELTLRNTLADLLIEFNLQLPSSDQNITSIVKSAINTQEEMNRQVFSLLVLNQFLPPESTGGGSGGASTSMLSSGLGSSSLELLSGQLNNWLSKVTTDVNIDFRYRAGEQGNTDQVSVALSTQLFNERVIIDGDVGVGGQKSQQGTGTGTAQQNQIVGNVSVEVKATRDGRLRIRAFNRSNDNNPLKNSAPYTQGVGLNYRIEFDSWLDLFKGKKKNKKNIITPEKNTNPPADTSKVNETEIIRD